VGNAGTGIAEPAGDLGHTSRQTDADAKRAGAAASEPVYFLQTLSFGVDAAIALNTVDLRKTTGTTGLRLYARAAASAIIHDLKTHHFEYSIDGKRYTNELLICAIQNGKTYGSGFKVAPSASLSDGLFDVCTAMEVGNTLKALYLLSKMKGGKHLKYQPPFNFYKAKTLRIKLDAPLPIQCDGERLRGLDFDISIVPHALEVLMGA
ncbi:MAG: hypothetical protein LBM21_03170, partial [Coriobacteriales bacterium]|nr:hypothetical protein [Coriobacteriales bacterium]